MVRDLEMLTASGYRATRIEVLDLFPTPITSRWSPRWSSCDATLVARRAATTPLLALWRSWRCSPAGADPTTRHRVRDRSPWTADRRPSRHPLRAEVLAEHPHDPTAFTQGLVVVRRRATSRPAGAGTERARGGPRPGRVLRSTDLDPELFGEGLDRGRRRPSGAAHVDRGRALVWNRSELTAVGEHRYDGEGGDQHLDDGRLVASDGSGHADRAPR